MDQSTSDMEVKTSKPEDQKVQGSLPQNDVISSLEDHIRFNDDVMKKQQLLLEQELSPALRKDLQEILEMNEKRNIQLKKELQEGKVQFSVVVDSADVKQKKNQIEEEKPNSKNILKRLSCEVICHIFRYLPDKDLFNQMLSDRFFEKSAGYVLQRRKISLSELNISQVGEESILEVGPHQNYTLKVENGAAICEGYEEQEGNNLTRAIHLLFTYYNCAEADVQFDYSDEIPLTMEAFFGPTPNQPGEKIKIGRLTIDQTPNAAILLGWVCPKLLEVVYPPHEWLMQEFQEELKQLVVGIKKIKFSGDYLREGEADQVMETCDAKNISMEDGKYWSDESIFSVIKANVTCDNKGATRTIKMKHSICSHIHWKMLLAILMNSYKENPGMQCTIGMPKCKFYLTIKVYISECYPLLPLSCQPSRTTHIITKNQQLSETKDEFQIWGAEFLLTLNTHLQTLALIQILLKKPYHQWNDSCCRFMANYSYTAAIQTNV